MYVRLAMEKVLLHNNLVTLVCGQYMPTFTCPDSETAKWLSTKIEEAFTELSEYLALLRKELSI